MSEKTLPGPMLREPFAGRLHDPDRLVGEMDAYGLDGLVVSSERNLFYLTGFNPIAHKADEPRPYALIISRDAPGEAILVIADYYLGHLAKLPLWVQDVRPVRAVMVPMDLPFRADCLDRFLPAEAAQAPWLAKTRSRYSDSSFADICQGALSDLNLGGTKRIGFDDLRLGHKLGLPGGQIADAYDPLMACRAIKTKLEVELIRTATRINQNAIEHTVGQWTEGMTWRQLNHEYHMAVMTQGGFVHDPGGMVLAHPRGADSAVSLETGFEEFEIPVGMHVMFDCHGSWNQYNWDGGKLWVAGDDADASTSARVAITAEVMGAIEGAMRPGVRVSELQALGRDIYRRNGCTDADDVLIFFHGLGLSHMDLPEQLSDGRSNGDWQVAEGMVIATHLLMPGGERERVWLEDVALVQTDGATPLFTWDFAPL